MFFILEAGVTMSMLFWQREMVVEIYQCTFVSLQ